MITVFICHSDVHLSVAVLHGAYESTTRRI
jgi:hypothetical protein